MEGFQRRGWPVARRLLAIGCLPLAAALFTGCASAPPPQPVAPPVFPAAPDEARFIYERTLRTSEDVALLKGVDKFKRLATGAPEEIRGLVKPFGVAARGGRVYVTDTVQRAVCVFDTVQGRYFEFGREDATKLQQPLGIDISPSGEVYVVDGSAKTVLVFTPEGKHLRSFGDRESLRDPTGIALSPDGKWVYVVDTAGVESQSHRVQVFDAVSGGPIRTLGKRGEAEGEFNFPILASTAPDGTLYVVDKGNFRVQAFSPEGKFLFQFGTLGRYPGQFASPKGVATDASGNIYVSDTAFGNVQIFNAKGELLMFIGSRGQSGAPAKFMLPAGVDVDEQGRVYMVDQFFRKVDVFRPAALAGLASQTKTSN